MEEEGLTLSKFREPLLKDLPFLYVFGILTALAHLTVGVIWENIPIKPSDSTRMTFPYMGGYVSLISLAFVFIIVYFILMLNHEPDIPKHLRRFILTLSALLLLVQCVIVIIFSIRANDFRVSKDQLSTSQYAIIFSATLLDILFTIISLPIYFYFVFTNMKSVHLTPDESIVSENIQDNHQEIRFEQQPQEIELRVESSQPLRVDKLEEENLHTQNGLTLEERIELMIKSRERGGEEAISIPNSDHQMQNKP